MLPGNVDVINWMYPLIWEKVLSIMEALIQQADDGQENLTEDSIGKAYQDAVLLSSLGPNVGEEEQFQNKLRGFRDVTNKFRLAANERLKDLDEQGFSPDIHVNKDLVKRSKTLGRERFIEEAVKAESFTEKFPLNQLTTHAGSSNSFSLVTGS